MNPTRCACRAHYGLRAAETRLTHVAPGHSVQHSRAWCADVERWPRAQEVDEYLKHLNGRHRWGAQPHPMLFIELKGRA